MTNLRLNASVEEILAAGQVQPDSVGSKRLVPSGALEPSALLRADYAEYLKIKKSGRFKISLEPML